MGKPDHPRLHARPRPRHAPGVGRLSQGVALGVSVRPHAIPDATSSNMACCGTGGGAARASMCAAAVHPRAVGGRCGWRVADGLQAVHPGGYVACGSSRSAARIVGAAAAVGPRCRAEEARGWRVSSPSRRARQDTAIRPIRAGTSFDAKVAPDDAHEQLERRTRAAEHVGLRRRPGRRCSSCRSAQRAQRRSALRGARAEQRSERRSRARRRRRRQVCEQRVQPDLKPAVAANCV